MCGMERNELINVLRGWHKAFKQMGRGHERNVKALAEAADMLEQGKWISVKDRVPEFPRFVLVYVKHPASNPFPAWSCIMTDMYLGDRWAENADEEVHEVTHWMPLPEPPKEE